MPDVKFERDLQRFDCLGLDLNRPVDSVKPSKFPYLKNCRSFQAGRIEPRYGLTDIAAAAVVAGQSPTHSCRRLNDPANTTWTRIVGVGTHLAYGQAAFTDIDSGYSGDPLALVPYRPDQAPDSWMYVADRSRMRKISASGSLHPIGLAAPTSAPSAALAAPSYKVVDEFDATAGWAQAGTAGAPGLVSRTPGGAAGSVTTIAQIIYDSGTTGWATLQLTSMVGVGRGERLTFATNPETATVQDVGGGKSATVETTIASIIYDAGTSGACSIALTTPIDVIDVHTLLRDSTVGENVRVLARIAGQSGQFSVRAVTVGTFAAGDNIQVLPSLRIYLVNNHAAAENVSNDAVTTAITVGTGTLTKTAALDLSVIATSVPTQSDDYMSIGLRVDRPDLVTEIKVQLDVDSATNDFTRNYYTHSIRPSDLTPSVRNLQPLISTRSTIVTRAVIDTPTSSGSNASFANIEAASSAPDSPGFNAPPNASLGQPFGGSSFSRTGGGRLLVDSITTPSDSNSAVSQELESGDSQWVDVRFRISDLIRVGTDDSRTLQNVVKIQILAMVTGTVNIDMDSWWIGGGFGPDDLNTTAIPYFYRYRARIPATGSTSNWSPAIRGGIDAYRQQINVTPTQYAAPSGTTLATGDIVLDIQRFGGEIAAWHYVGTTANGATPSFADKYADDIVLGLPSVEQQYWQPWPIISTPVSGTTGSVAGTSVNDAATNFKTTWAPGTEIKINGVPYTIYKVISTSRLEIVENAGSQTGVTWQIDEPVLMAQNLACLWGDEQLGAMFAVGDAINPGRLYFSNGNDPDSTRETNYLDITSPSEPLMNGVVYNLRSYVFSSERMFQILATGNPTQPWTAQEIPNGKGLFSRWGITRTPAPIIGILCRDGIYGTTGGAPIPLTDADLYETFPTEGNIGASVNGIPAPNIVSAQAGNLRLDYYDEFLYFDYPQVGGGNATLVLAFDLGMIGRGEAAGGWFWDNYTPNVQFHYGEEGAGVHSLLVGGVDGHLYQYAGVSDNGTAIAMEITTPSRDQGDSRLNKLYGDIMLDANTAGVVVTATPYLNNNATGLAPVAVTTASRLQTAIPLGAAWQTARNISLNLVCSVSTSARPFFYIWEPRWTFESAPISALAWEISPSTFGMENFKHMGLVRITHVSTVDLSLVITIDGVAQTTITIANSGGLYTQTVFRVPVYKGKLWKLRLSSTTEFRLDPRDTFFQIKPWGSPGPYQPLRLLGDYSLVEG